MSLWLPLSPSHFRLLRIYRQVDDTIRYVLEIHSMSNPPPFLALSYVCGTEDAIEPLKVRVRSHGTLQPQNLDHNNLVDVTIRANLATALRLFSQHLRNAKSFLGYDHIWVDAICIDQVNLQEKAMQVAAMHKIYTFATEVVICLGEQADHSSEAMIAVKELSCLRKDPTTELAATDSRLLSKNEVMALSKVLNGRKEIFQSNENFARLGLPLIQHEFWPALASLYSRRWFLRLWTFQEAMLARNCSVICGGMILDWQDLLQTAITLTETQLMYVAQISFTMSQRAPQSRTQALISHFEFPYYTEGHSGAYFLLHLHTTRTREVTEPRDRIYAILSLAPPNLRDTVVPDYQTPLLHVYREFTKRLLSYYGPNQVLTMVETEQKTPLLPSWCPDYDQPPSSSALPPPSSVGVQYQPVFREDPDSPNVVHLRGVYVDDIVAVVKDFTYQWRGGTHHVFGPDGDAAQISHWLDRCAAVVDQHKPQSINEAEAEALFTSAVLARTTSTTQSPPYPARAVEGLRALRIRMAQLRDARDQASAGTLSPEQGALIQPILAHIGRLWKGNAFFVTKGGRFGISSVRTEVGHRVCVLFGSPQMYVLRKVETLHQLVSSAHVTGFSIGEAVPDVETRHEDFALM